MNEEDNNPSWPAFLIGFNLAIKEQREGPLGARGKVFPNSGRWRDPNPKLYFNMKKILQAAQDDFGKQGRIQRC